MMQDEGFQVNEETAIDPMTDVPDSDKTLLPPAKNVLGSISRPRININEAKDLKSLGLGIKLIEGITVDDPEQGEVVKYVNSYVDHGWMTFCFWAAPSRSQASDWFKNKKHLISTKQLLKALGYDVANPPVINDAFLKEIDGKSIRFDIVQEEDTVKDENGVRQKTGNYSNKIKNIKAA